MPAGREWLQATTFVYKDVNEPTNCLVNSSIKTAYTRLDYSSVNVSSDTKERFTILDFVITIQNKCLEWDLKKKKGKEENKSITARPQI